MMYLRSRRERFLDADKKSTATELKSHCWEIVPGVKQINKLIN